VETVEKIDKVNLGRPKELLTEMKWRKKIRRGRILAIKAAIRSTMSMSGSWYIKVRRVVLLEKAAAK